jgi:uncharacterized coiled-coil protein SlyX
MIHLNPTQLLPEMFKRIWPQIERYGECKKDNCIKRLARLTENMSALTEKIENLQQELLKAKNSKKKKKKKEGLIELKFIQSTNMLERSKILLFAAWTNANNQLQNSKSFSKPLDPKQYNLLRDNFLQGRFHFHMHMINKFEPSVKNLFELAWTNYINPLESKVLFESNVKYLEQNVNELNIAWNELHLALTKRNLKISKQTKTLLNVMHRRWNSILKIGLR